MARAKQKSTTKDPVFAAIEKHRKSMKELYEALKPVAWNKGDPDLKKSSKYLNRELAVADELIATAPTTLQGLLAVLTCINGVTSGHFPLTASATKRSSNRTTSWTSLPAPRSFSLSRSGGRSDGQERH